MSPRILVALDGTPQAERALSFAEVLARAAGGQLKVVRASAAGPTDYIERALDAIARRLRETGLPAEWSVEQGEAVPSILEAARSWPADLIALATSRSSALDRWLNDGVADAIVRSAEVPVLVVPPDRQRPSSPRPPRRMLVPLDGSRFAEQALGPAVELAGAVRAELILLRVFEEDDTPRHTHAHDAERYMQTVRDDVRAGLPERQVASHVAAGSATVAIAQATVDLAIDLIAMSTRGRGGFARAVMGSTATATLEQSTVPLLLVGPAAMRLASTAPGQVRRTRHMDPLNRTASNDTPNQGPKGLGPEPARATAHARTTVAPAMLAYPAYDAIDEQGRQSFPASDPPSWTGSTI